MYVACKSYKNNNKKLIILKDVLESKKKLLQLSNSIFSLMLLRLFIYFIERVLYNSTLK